MLGATLLILVMLLPLHEACFGMNCSLDGISHLVSLSEYVSGATSGRNTFQSDLFDFAIELLLVRLLQGRLDTDASVRSNRKNILPACVQGFRFVAHALRTYTYRENSVDATMLSATSSPFTHFTAKQDVQTNRDASLVVMAQSAHNLYQIITQVFSGESDTSP